MSLFDYFIKKKEPSSAQSAKDRLQIVIAHQRGSGEHVSSMIQKIRQDIVDVINKYIDVDDNAVNVNQTGQVLELNVVLPDSVQKQ